MNGSTVERSAIVKYLGAWFDEDLNMKEHITKKMLCQYDQHPKDKAHSQVSY